MKREMKIKTTAGSKIFDVINYALLTLFCVTVIIPFIAQLTDSFTIDALLNSGRSFVFTGWIKDNWALLLTSNVMWRSAGVTLIVTLCGTLFQLFLSTTYAYPLSRKELPLRNFWTTLMLITMFFSGGLIPTYFVYVSLGLRDTLPALFLGGMAAWNTLIIRNFMMAIPNELVESSRLDGANEFTIFFRIMLPLSKAAIATVALWLLVSFWNAWVPCMIYITTPSKYVLQIILRNMIQQAGSAAQTMFIGVAGINHSSQRGLEAAVTLFITVPILCVYPFLQKYFVKGIMMGSIKG